MSTDPDNHTNYALGWATSADYDDLSDVMFDAVRRGPSHYTEAQRKQWVPERRHGDAWAARLNEQVISLARNEKGVVGFMSLAPDGYIDFAYIRPEAQGTGLFRQMFRQIEQYSAERGDARLWLHASLMAQQAFATMGFEIVERQTVHIGDESFERFEMEKPMGGLMA
ncbi:GNAT family N-acetyltransferase [Blastomonas sp.]|uniref:GNAT family N-acetyltransferase n=1 Tax=Blastomonas sp. TaxID=1909299 RepID=UPI003593D63B